MAAAWRQCEAMDEEKGVNRGVQRDDGEGQGGSVAPSREEDEARVAHEDEVERREELLVSSPDHREGHLVLGLAGWGGAAGLAGGLAG